MAASVTNHCPSHLSLLLIVSLFLIYSLVPLGKESAWCTEFQQFIFSGCNESCGKLVECSMVSLTACEGRSSKEEDDMSFVVSRLLVNVK